jgi:hypothetical protein
VRTPQGIFIPPQTPCRSTPQHRTGPSEKFWQDPLVKFPREVADYWAICFPRQLGNSLCPRKAFLLLQGKQGIQHDYVRITDGGASETMVSAFSSFQCRCHSPERTFP